MALATIQAFILVSSQYNGRTNAVAVRNKRKKKYNKFLSFVCLVSAKSLTPKGVCFSIQQTTLGRASHATIDIDALMWNYIFVYLLLLYSLLPLFLIRR